MNVLKRHWVSNPVYDFEIKKYQYLAFEQKASQALDDRYILPWKERVSQVFEDATLFKHSKNISNALRRRGLSGLDLLQMKVIEDLEADVSELEEVKETIEYIVPRLQSLLDEFSQLEENLANDLLVEPLGLIGTKLDNGIILLNHSNRVIAFKYRKGLIDYSNNIQLEMISSYRSGMQHIKEIQEEVRKQAPYISTHTWLVTGGDHYPLKNSVIPAVSRIVYELI